MVANRYARHLRQVLPASGAAPLADRGAALTALAAAEAAAGRRTLSPAPSALLTPLLLEGLGAIELRSPVFTGSIPVAARRLRDTDPRYFDIPAGIRSSCWVVDLGAHGILPDAAPSGHGVFGKGGSQDAGLWGLTPFIGGEPLSETVWPATGWNRATSVSGTNQVSFASLPTWSSLNWSGRNRVRVSGFFYGAEFFDWWGSATVSGTTLTLDSPGRSIQGGNIGASSRFRVHNVLETLAAGQYYLDTERGLLYFQSDTDPAGRLTVATNSGPLIVVGPGTQLTIRGGRLAECRGEGVRVLPGGTLVMDGVAVQAGTRGIVGDFGSGSRISNCSFACGAQDIMVLSSGTRTAASLVSGGMAVRSCSFSGARRRTLTYAGGIEADLCVGLVVEDCRFEDFPGSAVRWDRCNDMVFRRNAYARCCREADDVGVVYHGKWVSAWGNVFEDETFTDCVSPVFPSGTAVCYYWDDGACGSTVRRVTALRCGEVVSIGGGRSNKIEGLVAVDCASDPVHVDDRMVANGGWNAMGSGGDARIRGDYDAFAAAAAWAKYGAEWTSVLSDQPSLPKHTVISGAAVRGGPPLVDYSNSFGGGVVTMSAMA